MAIIACAQLRYRNFEVAAGIPRIAANLTELESKWNEFELSNKGVEILTLGEFWLSSPAGSAEYVASAIDVDGEFATLIGDFSRKHNCYLLANIAEIVNGTLFDSSVIAAPDGSLPLVYREIAGGLLATSPIATPVGSEVPSIGTHKTKGLGVWVPVVETDLGTLSTVVGSDLTYPEISMGLTLAGVDIVLHPNKEPQSTEGPYQSLKTARALEGGFAIASCNVANTPGHPDPSWASSRGRSAIISASGKFLVESDTDAEDVIVGEVDIAAVREARKALRYGRRTSSDWREHCASMFSA